MAAAVMTDIFEGNHPISQYYGQNAAYYRKFGLNGHEGVDFALPTGTKLLAPFPLGSIIIRTGWDVAYGYYIVVWDSKQLVASWFAHCSRIYVSPGQQVKKGFVIGLSGNTGNSSGPHLHSGFVSTDKYGNRLYRTNGYQGYRNELDRMLVNWSLSVPKGRSLEEPIRKPKVAPEERMLTVEQVIKKDLPIMKEVFQI